MAGEPIRGVLGIAKQAQSLYDVLREYGYTAADGSLLAPLGWDWRKALDDATVQADLAGAIERLAQQHGRKVVVIIHSTGGLVLRALLEAKPRSDPRLRHPLGGHPQGGPVPRQGRSLRPDLCRKKIDRSQRRRSEGGHDPLPGRL